jgi:hypothetical protein
LADDIDAGTGSISAYYSLVGDGRGSGLTEAPVGLLDANGNLIGGPVNGVIDPLLGPLAYNGGPVFLDGSKMLTHALLPGSPAIDAGDPAAVAGVGDAPEFDQRGMPWSRVVGGRIDIGAVEAQANPLAGDYNFDGVVNAGDYTVWRNTLGSTNDLRADGSGETFGVPDGVVDELDYAFWKANFGNVIQQGAGGREQGEADLRPGALSVGEGVDAVALVAAANWEGEAPAEPLPLLVEARREPRPPTLDVKSTSLRVRSHTNVNESTQSDALVAWLASRTAPKSRDDGAITSAAHDESSDAGEFCTASDRVFDLFGRAG